MKPVKILGLVAAMLTMANFAFTQTWNQAITSANGWLSVASSADGSKLFAVQWANGAICRSTNSGVTWATNKFANTFWTSICSSADGTKIVAAGSQIVSNSLYYTIFTSTNSGIDWTNTAVPATNAVSGVPNYWVSVASSADGSKLIAAATGSTSPGSIYTSSDSGITWTQTSAPITNWNSVASSADGVKLAAVGGANGYSPRYEPIYLSTNSGVNWFPSGPTNVSWASVASSADGSTLIAGSEQTTATSATIYTSTNSGLTWMINNLPGAHPFGTWESVAMSADGTKLVAAKEEGQAGGVIYTSADSGNTWTSNNVPAVNWWSVVSSADGGRLVAADFDSIGGIWISQSTPLPQLSISPVNTSLTLSWTIPSTNFVLQQSADLFSWADMTDAPALNLTNLQNQVTLTPSNSAAFYRLKTP
jgi:hypothetical protein